MMHTEDMPNTPGKRHSPSNDDLLRVLAPALQIAGTTSRIERVERVTSPYGSSFPLDDVTVHLADGSRLPLLFKNVDPGAMSAAARLAKPAFLDDPLREISLYRQVLDPQELGTATLYASAADASSGQFWLLLECIPGYVLSDIGEFTVWRQTARWLARMHHRFMDETSISPSVYQRLIQHDAASYHRWLERAEEFTAGSLPAGLVSDYPQLVRETLDLSQTLIHGEFYSSNVLVDETAFPPRICPVDWERAGWGPGWLDVAALTAGSWTEHEKTALAREYLAEWESLTGTAPSGTHALRGWYLCRLHLAVQWLGWSSEWTPPLEHQHDWQGEVELCLQQLHSTC